MKDVEGDGYFVARSDLVPSRTKVGSAVADPDRIENQILADPKNKFEESFMDLLKTIESLGDFSFK